MIGHKEGNQNEEGQNLCRRFTYSVFHGGGPLKSWTQASDLKPAWASMPCKGVEAKGVGIRGGAGGSFWFFRAR